MSNFCKILYQVSDSCFNFISVGLKTLPTSYYIMLSISVSGKKKSLHSLNHSELYCSVQILFSNSAWTFSPSSVTYLPQPSAQCLLVLTSVCGTLLFSSFLSPLSPWLDLSFWSNTYLPHITCRHRRTILPLLPPLTLNSEAVPMSYCFHF